MLPQNTGRAQRQRPFVHQKHQAGLNRFEHRWNRLDSVRTVARFLSLVGSGTTVVYSGQGTLGAMIAILTSPPFWEKKIKIGILVSGILHRDVLNIRGRPPVLPPPPSFAANFASRLSPKM